MTQTRPRTSLAATTPRKIMLTVLLVDTIAAGAFYPLTFLYLTLTTELPVAEIGLILTAGGIAALVLNPVAGTVADRFGAQRAVVLANFCVGLGYAGLIAIAHPAQLVAAVALISFSQRLYWAGWPVFVAEQVEEGETLDRWFALVNAFKSGALGLGAAVAAVALALGSADILRVVLIAAVVTSFISAAVFHRLRMRPNAEPSAPRAPGAVPEAGGWRTVLADRPYLAMTAAHTALTFAWLLPAVVLPVYFVYSLNLPPWVPSIAFAVNTAMTVLLQSSVTRVLVTIRRTRSVLVGACAFLLACAVFAGADTVGRTVGVVLALAGIMLFSLGEMSVGPAASALAIEASPVELRGRYSSLFQTSWTISNVAGPAIVGALLQWSSPALWAVLSVLVAVGGLGFVACERLLPAGVLRPAATGGAA